MPIKHRRQNKVKLSVRKQTADKRLVLRNGRTPEQQLAELDKRLGKGVGAKKERKRLTKLAAGEAPAPKAETPKAEKKAPKVPKTKKKA